jgi:putative flippase GtrA
MKAERISDTTSVPREGLIDGVGVRFVIVGSVSALLFFLLFYVLNQIGDIVPIFASALAYGVTFPLTYVAHRVWTFRSSGPVSRSLPRYLLVQLTCLVLSSLLTQGLYSIVEFKGFAIAGAATVIASGVSFLASRIWVFANAKN